MRLRRGAAAGLAIGFKYTAGLVLLAPALALALPLAAARDRAALRAAALGGLALAAGAVATFFITNPYFFFDLDTALHQLRGQAELAGSQDKFGQEQDTGPLYYLDSLTLGPRLRGGVRGRRPGAVLLARRDRARLAILLIFPVALFIYLSVQSRFFGRWLLPVYPALALLAGYAFVQAFDAVRARAPQLRWPALAVGLRRAAVAAARRRRALDGGARPRRHARDRAPVAGRALRPRPAHHHRAGRAGALLLPGHRRASRSAPGARSSSTSSSATSARRGSSTAARCAPRCSTRYRDAGYCMVMTFDLIRGRAEAAGDRTALAYYDALERESDVVYQVSPYRADEEPPPFSFDLSYSYYSPAYERPGPEVRIHRIHDCVQRYGPQEGA